jgi:hypothetical protein
MSRVTPTGGPDRDHASGRPRLTAGVVVSCPCGEVYELKPEYAGRLLECPTCSRQLRARGVETVRPRDESVDTAFDRDVFLLRQRALTISSQYEVWAEDGQPVLYVERPTYPLRTVLAYALGAIATLVFLAWVGTAVTSAPRETALVIAVIGYALVPFVFLVVSMSLRPFRHVTIYRDDSRREAILKILQDQRFAAVTRSYTVTTAAGEPIARFRKHYLHNFVRKRWYVETPAGAPVAMAIEDSVVLSLLRRLLGPLVGTLFGVLRINFVFVSPSGEILGEFNRKLTLLDRYVLDLTGDGERAFDRRVALALGIMLDTGERR